MRYAWMVCLCCWLAAMGPALAAQEQSAESPSILVLVGDDVSKDFGCYGNQVIQTPHVDELARQGLLFTNAFLTTSSCSPSRISMLTGKYPHATGAEDLHMPLPEGQTFVTTYLKQKGYFTGHMQKTHYGENGSRQFDWYSRDLDLEGFLDECGERPFFMWVGFRDAHRPYQENTFDPPHDSADVTVPPYLADTPETRQDLAMYYDEVARMDMHIGQMVQLLKQRGRFENTIMVVVADNGMPFPRAKGTAYDSGIATPLVITWPRVIQPGGQHKTLASVIDLAPTFLAVAGIEQPAQMHGESMLDILKQPKTEGREAVFAQRNWHNCDEHIRTVRTMKYKLIRNAYLDEPYGNPSDCSSSPAWDSLLQLKRQGDVTPAQMGMFRAPRPLLELYDIEADPHELNNLIGSDKHALIVRDMENLLDAWIEETGDFPPSKRRRGDNTNRVTGVKFSSEIPEMTNAETSGS